jgi:phage gp36-like protein
MYVSHAQLAERPGARELAQVGSADHEAIVDYALMEATLLGTDRSAWDAEEIADADAVLQRIDDAVAGADGLINGYLVKRGHAVPLDPVPSIVTVWSRDISRYYLHKDRLSSEGTDPIVRAYKDAMRLLEQVVAGKFSLGIGDETATPGAGSPAYTTGPDTLRTALADYE